MPRIGVDRATRLASESEPNTLLGIIDIVEHLGNEQLIYVQTPGAWAEARTTARVAAGTPVKVGDHMALAVDLAKLHLFDPATGERFK